MKYRPELDGLRAVAIGMVAAFHVSSNFFPGGWVGVDVFFVLSGYLITAILIGELDSSARIDLPRFWLRRSLRLWPALATLLIGVTLIDLLLLRTPVTWLVWPIVMAASYLMNWNRAFGWGEVGVFGHTWSLAVEEQFYIVWPVLLMVMPRRFRLAGTITLLIAVLGWRFVLLSQGASVARLYNGFDTHADSLLIGCVLAQIKLADGVLLNLGRFWPVPLLLLLGLALSFQYDNAFGIAFGVPVVAAIAAWIILAAHMPGPLNTALSLAPIVYLGRISYGIYLWHDPMLIYLRGHLPKGTAFLAVLLAIGIASLSFFLVERPLLRLKARIGRSKVAGRNEPAMVVPTEAEGAEVTR